MGGSNPYIEQAETEVATKPFTVTFKTPEGIKEVKVDPDKIPYGETGLPGSLLDIGMGAGIDLEHACGGVCACSTCHVIVKEGLETCNEATDDENDQLDEAPGITPSIPPCLPNCPQWRAKSSCGNPGVEQESRQGKSLNTLSCFRHIDDQVPNSRLITGVEGYLCFCS